MNISELSDHDYKLASFNFLFNLITLHSRDWSLESSDACIYGIVCGWDDKSYEELERKFNWGSEATARLKHMHIGFKEARDYYDNQNHT